MNIKKKNETTIKEGSIIETKDGTLYLISCNTDNFIVLINLKTYFTTSPYTSLAELFKKKDIINIYNNSDLYLG